MRYAGGTKNTDEIQVSTGSDCGGCRTTRKSTTGRALAEAELKLELWGRTRCVSVRIKMFGDSLATKKTLASGIWKGDTRANSATVDTLPLEMSVFSGSGRYTHPLLKQGGRNEARGEDESQDNKPATQSCDSACSFAQAPPPRFHYICDLRDILHLKKNEKKPQ